MISNISMFTQFIKLSIIIIINYLKCYTVKICCLFIFILSIIILHFCFLNNNNSLHLNAANFIANFYYNNNFKININLHNNSNKTFLTHIRNTKSDLQIFSQFESEAETEEYIREKKTDFNYFFNRVVKWPGNKIQNPDVIYRIPPKIQQVFISNYTKVFDQYRTLIQSIIKTNPNYEYWFWLHNDAKTFAKYANFSKLYLSAPSFIYKSDIMRYFIIYEFGGIYLDMDFMSYKSLDQLLKNYSCILGREPDPIAFGGRNRRYLLTNSFFAMRKHHPFLKFIVDRLLSKTSFGKIVVKETGPDFMTDCLVEYASLKNCSLPESDIININNAPLNMCEDCVLLPWHWVNSIIDKAKIVQNLCESALKNNNKDGDKACTYWRDRGYSKSVKTNDTYVDHMWLHLGWYEPASIGIPGKASIETIVNEVFKN